MPLPGGSVYALNMGILKRIRTVCSKVTSAGFWKARRTGSGRGASQPHWVTVDQWRLLSHARRTLRPKAPEPAQRLIEPGKYLAPSEISRLHSRDSSALTSALAPDNRPPATT